MADIQVNYGFTEADQLSGALSAAAQKINWLVWLRESQRGRQLGGPASDNWQGERRNAFEEQFRSQQRALRALAEDMQRLKSAVDDATNQARAESNRLSRAPHSGGR